MIARISLVLLFTCFSLFFSTSNLFGFQLSEAQIIKLLKGEKDWDVFFRVTKAIDDVFLEKIRSDVKLKLQMIGYETKDYKSGRPYLLIDLYFHSNLDGYSGHLELSFRKAVSFVGENIRGYAEVWSDEVLTFNSKNNGIRDTVNDLLDKFLILYLKANPRQFINK